MGSTRRSRSATAVPVVVSLNLEPDPRVTTPDATTPWDGTDPVLSLVEEWRDGHPDRRVGWYWRCDPSIEVGYGDTAWALRRWRDQISRSVERGDEVGVHPHYWRWFDDFGTFVSDAGDDEWKAHCIRTSVEAMRAAVGVEVRTLMMGDGYVDRASARTLDELGIEIDLTLEPGSPAREQMMPTEFTTGTMPDRRRTPHRPFRPSRRSPVRPAVLRRARHWALPLTSTTTPTIRSGVVVDRIGTPANLGLDPWRFRHVVASGLAASVDAGAPYLHVVVRSDVGVNEGLRRFTIDNLAWLSDGMDGLAEPFGGVCFVTPHEALELLGRT